MPEYPIVVRDIGGQNRLGVEKADDLEADVREIVTDGYEQIDVTQRDDGDVIGTVVAGDDRQKIVDVRWDA